MSAGSVILFTFVATLITNLPRNKLFNHGKIWCYRNPSYFSSGIVAFGGKKFQKMKGLGSGIKEFKCQGRSAS
jgi:hypothetical protein